MIYTSYFAYMKKIPSNIKRVAICEYIPDWYNGRFCKELSPGELLLKRFKNREYTEKEYEHIYRTKLNKIGIDRIITLIDWYGKDVALICYESPEKFCHRHILANFLNEHGYPCEEFKKGISIIENDYKELYYADFCKDCKNIDVGENSKPCCDCLCYPMDLCSHKPVKFEAFHI